MTGTTGEQLALLDLIAADDPRKPNWEYAVFVAVLRMVKTPDGHISQNDVRRAMSSHEGLVVPGRRYASFWHRARREGFICVAGHDVSDSSSSGYVGKPQRRYRWMGDPT